MLSQDLIHASASWTTIYFDKGLTKVQRDAIAVVGGRIFPVKWRPWR